MEDYCDRCGAQGKARWFKDELELIFCGHHDYEFGATLNATGWYIDLGYAYERNPELAKV